MTATYPRLVIGIGGTAIGGSSSERALRIALGGASESGAKTEMYSGPDIDLPMFNPRSPAPVPKAALLIDACRRADGIILSSPGYHGSISGLLKNVLDYVELMRTDARTYFDGRAVGCIVCAMGWQATGSTLVAMRSIVHALRGWPTPLGVGVNTREIPFSPDGTCSDVETTRQLKLLGQQTAEFAKRWTGSMNKTSIVSCRLFGAD